jgi:membrane-associated protease RseP (regulator of RpoE activity)
VSTEASTEASIEASAGVSEASTAANTEAGTAANTEAGTAANTEAGTAANTEAARAPADASASVQRAPSAGATATPAEPPEPILVATRPAPLTAGQLALHFGLFAASCVTTYLFGGVWFSATLMTILVCHEFGHYLAARHHGVAVSLPFFIPLPPQVSLGTLGAVIRMPEAIRRRSHLFDVGVAGPLAGMAVALPLLVLGLSHSTLGPVQPGNIIEGNSLLYAGLKWAVLGHWLPGPVDGVDLDVQLHPMAFAAWVGLLVTMINLIPVGQLDGGHIARAALGDRHELWSRRLHMVMPAIGATLAIAMFATALAHDKSLLGALRYASYGGLPWCTWSLLLFLMHRSAGEYHPSVEAQPLGKGRRRLAIAVAILFLLIFTPVPFRPPL